MSTPTEWWSGPMSPECRRTISRLKVGDDALTIRGEHKYDHEEEREGVFRSERAYGSFYRVVPLPEGVMTDNAKATFKNGVLEVLMPARAGAGAGACALHPRELTQRDRAQKSNLRRALSARDGT